MAFPADPAHVADDAFRTGIDALMAMAEGGIMPRKQAVSPRASTRLVLVYPAGIPEPLERDAIVAYERMAPGLDGTCAVFADGHAAHITADEYEQLTQSTSHPKP